MIPHHRNAKHRRPLTGAQMRANRSEEDAYRAWCHKHQLDPQDTESALSYEGNIGYLYIDYDGYIGEHL